jgi:hypothetical protein
MVSRRVSGGALAAAVGAAMIVAASSSPSSSFTLSAPSLERPVATADIHPVWWDRWGRWHPNRWGWRRWHRPYYAWGPGPVYRPWGPRCWWTWRGRVCRW